jgi:hypothetical protein
MTQGEQQPPQAELEQADQIGTAAEIASCIAHG